MRLAIAGLIATTTVLGLALIPAADARDGCGRGWFFNGRACVQAEDDYDEPTYRRPQPPPPSGYYRERGYGPGPGYDRGYAPGGGGGFQPIQGQNNFGQPEQWFRPNVNRAGQPICPQGFTVQDGVCKRFRGY